MPLKPESIVDAFAQVVPPESARLNLGKREQVFSIAGADHRTVCKFARATDAQFLLVAGALEELAEAALDQQQQRPPQAEIDGARVPPTSGQQHLPMSADTAKWWS